jgi:hypothetical protein
MKSLCLFCYVLTLTLLAAFAVVASLSLDPTVSVGDYHIKVLSLTMANVACVGYLVVVGDNND